MVQLAVYEISTLSYTATIKTIILFYSFRHLVYTPLRLFKSCLSLGENMYSFVNLYDRNEIFYKKTKILQQSRADKIKALGENIVKSKKNVH